MMRDPIGTSLLIIAILCLIIGAAYWLGGSKNRLREHLNHKTTLEQMNGAVNPDLDDNGILNSLRDLAK